MLKINELKLISKPFMNVLGVIFDTKLQWAPQVNQSLKKSASALNAIRLIKRFFNTTELVHLVTSNFYSILFYNSEVWHLPSLKNTLKQSLLSASAKALKLCMYYPDPFTSFIKIHEINKRALPENLLIYKHAIQLHKLYNSKSITNEWLHLNTNQVLTSRQTTFITHKTNTNKVGLNALANRLYILNGKIPLDWLNLSVNSFKTKCKIEILKL